MQHRTRKTKSATDSFRMSDAEMWRMRCIEQVVMCVGQVRTTHDALHGDVRVPNRLGLVREAADALLTATAGLISLGGDSDDATREHTDAVALRINSAALKYAQVLQDISEHKPPFHMEQLLPALKRITEKLLPLADELGREVAPWLGEFISYRDEDYCRG